MAEQRAFQKIYNEYKGQGGYGRFVVLGSNYLAGVALLGYLGHVLDKKTGHDHLFMVIGAVLGIVWATYEAFKIAFKLARESEMEMKAKKERNDKMDGNGDSGAPSVD